MHTLQLLCFTETLESHGITLQEKDVYTPPYSPGIDYDDEELVQNMYERQKKVHELGPVSAAVKSMIQPRRDTRWKRDRAKKDFDYRSHHDIPQAPPPQNFDPKQDGY